MINRVTFKVISRCQGTCGYVSLNAQCFVNKQRVVVPLSIYIEGKYYDEKKEVVKVQHDQAKDYNDMISNARSRAATVLREANEKSIRLDKDNFRDRFTFATRDYDFVKFWQDELQTQRGAIADSTWDLRNSQLSKFVEFKNCLPFDRINEGTIDDYAKFLRKRKNNINTISTALKIFKTYILSAIKKGVAITNPFEDYKITTGEGRIIFLTLEEQHQLVMLYDCNKLAVHLRESLLIYLVQSFTSLRISDARLIDESWIPNGIMDFKPYKTRRYDKHVRFGLSKVALRFLREFFQLKLRKQLKSDQRINDDLKLIAAYAGIYKSVTTHVARHTFATTFLTLGGHVQVLQEIMGHARIETTMRYVHVIDEIKTEQMGNFDNEFK